MIKNIFLVIITSLVSCLLIGCNKTEVPIFLPQSTKIDSIKIEALDSSEITYTDSDWIEEFISIISDAKNTNKSSVQDFPLADNYGTIHIFSKDNSLTIYYYEENGRYFLEQPYHGIYEIEHANAISSCSRFA